jgi:hypothetical protein
MGAPKGNRYNMYSKNLGRPATWTQEIISKEAEILEEWAQNEDAIILREFAGLRGYPHTYMYDWSNLEHKSFNQDFYYAFHTAKTLIGCRREKISMDKSSQRDLGMYFEELDAYEDKKAEKRAKMRLDQSTDEFSTLDKLPNMALSGDLSQK